VGSVAPGSGCKKGEGYKKDVGSFLGPPTVDNHCGGNDTTHALHNTWTRQLNCKLFKKEGEAIHKDYNSSR
jgi:hypothetical protein